MVPTNQLLLSDFNPGILENKGREEGRSTASPKAYSQQSAGLHCGDSLR